MLSPKELFKFRSGLDHAIPSKGGEKEFMPDGSVHQERHIENFHQVRERMISEPRVVRSHDLVKGEWKPDKDLVQIFHGMKNFWVHMGFVDDRRKWLYPEEALFLVETGILEMWYQDLPLSIQEVYAVMVGERIQLEYYQVYAHLRRIGYVALRHQGRYEFTQYERQIGLDKHAKRKKMRNRGKEGDKSSKSTKGENEDEATETSSLGESANEVKDDNNSKNEKSKNGQEISSDISEAETSSFGDSANEVKDSDKSNGQERSSNISEIDRVKVAANICREWASNTDTSDMSEMDVEEVNADLELNSSGNKALDCAVYHTSEVHSYNIEASTDGTNQVKKSEWNFDEIVFPNFKSTQETVLVSKPNVDYIPQGTDLTFSEAEYSFEKKKYINTKKIKERQRILDEKMAQGLDFSHPEIMTGWHKVRKSCKNWKEYKVAVVKEKALWDRSDVFPHLYKSKVKPLVKPELARSTNAILEQLMVIEENVPSTVMNKPEILPEFDVYVPNSKFKKSRPGVPDFRVKVSRTCDPVPGLHIVNSISSYLNDEAPLQWAVVDNGNIAFYSMSDMALPKDIFLG